MEMKNVFIHHVYFWLKNADDAEDLNQLITGLKNYPLLRQLNSFILVNQQLPAGM